MSRRPPDLRPPDHLSPSPPLPVPAPAATATDDPLGRNPTRYGDWERKGVAVDF